MADWRRALAAAASVAPPPWAPKGVKTDNQGADTSPEGYKEPPPRDWAAEAAGAGTPDKLTELIRDADTRRERRDAARTLQRENLEAQKRSLDALDAAAEAEAAATGPLRSLFARAQKSAARAAKIAAADEAARLAAEAARLAAAANEREARARAEVEQLSDDEAPPSDDESSGTVAMDE